MAVRFETLKPAELLVKIKKAIDDGELVTWSYDSDGDFTHTAKQWINQAWLRPSIGAGQLSFYIISPRESAISTVVYAVYHGRFIEAVLSHCDDSFKRAFATAMPEGGDKTDPS